MATSRCSSRGALRPSSSNWRESLMAHMLASHLSVGVLGKGFPSPITQSLFSSGMFRLPLSDGSRRRRLMFPDVKGRTLATHFFLVESPRLYGAFFMVDLHPQARVLLASLLFLHMVPSVPYGLFLGRAGERSNTLASAVNAIAHTSTIIPYGSPFLARKRNPLSVSSGPARG